MTSTYFLNFTSPPSLWGIYPRILAARKPALVPAGRVVPRIEARLSRFAVDAGNLRRYREICGCSPSSTLPLAYPHVLASSLQLAMLASARFPVGLLGLVHVANRIEQFGALDPGAGGELACWIEGHEQTPRGQLLVLHTEWATATGPLWRERCTFLARARRSSREAPSVERPDGDARRGKSGADAGPPGLEGTDDGPVVTTSFLAPAGLGRRYGKVSGDLNPIHIADVTARAFGFRAAIAHGMWSLARCAAELETALPPDAPQVLDVQFRRPVFLPSMLSLQHARRGDGVRFALLDSQGARTHLAGTLRPAA